MLLSLSPKKVTKESLPEIESRWLEWNRSEVHAISTQYQKAVNVEIANPFCLQPHTAIDFGNLLFVTTTDFDHTKQDTRNRKLCGVENLSRFAIEVLWGGV